MQSGFSPATVAQTDKIAFGSAESCAPESDPQHVGIPAKCSEVAGRFKRMMEAHDLVRARLLGSTHGASYLLARD